MADNINLDRIPVREISVDTIYSTPLLSDDGIYFLHPAGVPIDAQLLRDFTAYGIDKIAKQKVVQSQGVKTAAEEKNLGQLPPQESWAMIENGAKLLQRAQSFYDWLINFTIEAYQTVKYQQTFKLGEPQDRIRDFIAEIRSLGLAALRFKDLKSTEPYLYRHSAKSFILTIALGLMEKMPSHRLINLGMAALFHEVGLVDTPEDGHTKQLSRKEVEEMRNHVYHGVHLLQKYNFGTEIIDGILQHHERLDGSGYPYGIEDLSPIGRNLGLSCSYIAMIESMHSKLSVDAINDIIRNSRSSYDSTLVKHLLVLLSLYPIGSYVRLADKFVGKVIKNNPHDPRYPLVQLYVNPHGKLVEPVTVVQTSTKRPIAEALSIDEIRQLIITIQNATQK